MSIPELENTTITKVYQLILDIPPRWKDQLLANLFSSHDREKIKKIRLTTDLEDFVYWTHEPNDTYTVKSGYR